MTWLKRLRCRYKRRHDDRCRRDGFAGFSRAFRGRCFAVWNAGLRAGRPRKRIGAVSPNCPRAFSTASSRMFRCAFSAIRRQEPNGNTTHSSSMQNSMRPKALPPRPAPPETPSAATDRKQSLFPGPSPPAAAGRQPPLPADASSSEERIRRQKRLSEGALPGRMRFAFIVTFVRCKSARSRNSGSGRGTP